MKWLTRSVLTLLSLVCLWISTAQAQETGPLMMRAELGFTLGGMVGGAAVGLVVWLTDPGGPVPISENVKNGAVLGTVVGALFGYYVLYTASRGPQQSPQLQGLDELLGARLQYDHSAGSPYRGDSASTPKAFARQDAPTNTTPAIQMPVFHYRF